MYNLCNSNSIEDEVYFLFFYSAFQISHNKFADEVKEIFPNFEITMLRCSCALKSLYKYFANISMTYIKNDNILC